MDRFFRNCGRPANTDEFLDGTSGTDRVATPPRHARRHHHNERKLSKIKPSKDTFEVNLDMHEFQPSEIKVKTMGNIVVIEGNHEERLNPHDLFSVHFVRRCCLLPDDTINHEVHHHLDSNGILKIEVNRHP